MNVKVESVQIKNFKALTEVDLQVSGNHVYVIGPNDHGKSSFLDFVFGFTGQTLKKNLTLEKPSEMITKGHDKMEGTIDMGDYQLVVKGKRVKGTEKISVELFREGVLQSSPRALLDELIGVNNFDIDGFLRMSEKEQVSFYKSLLGIDDKLQVLDTQHQQVFAERTDLNRDIRRAEAELENSRISLQGLTRPEKIHLDTVLSERSEAEVALQSYQEKMDKFNNIEARLDEAGELLVRLEKQLAELQEQKQQLNKEKVALEDLKKRGEKWLAETPKPELPDISQLVNEATETNALAARFEALDVAKKKVSDYHRELEAFNEQLEAIDKERKTIIADANHPVPHMSFDDERGLLFKGLPFKSSQINTATKIIVALQMQLPLMKHARFVRFDASLLDVKSMELVKQWAAKYDLQLFMEVVDRQAEGGLKFEIEETIAPQEETVEVGF